MPGIIGMRGLAPNASSASVVKPAARPAPVLVAVPANPWGPAQQFRDEPAWEQLELWDRLRATYLGLDPDPQDRGGKGFQHG